LKNFKQHIHGVSTARKRRASLIAAAMSVPSSTRASWPAAKLKFISPEEFLNQFSIATVFAKFSCKIKKW
jgi:hypothetical protein